MIPISLRLGPIGTHPSPTSPYREEQIGEMYQSPTSPYLEEQVDGFYRSPSSPYWEGQVDGVHQLPSSPYQEELTEVLHHSSSPPHPQEQPDGTYQSPSSPYRQGQPNEIYQSPSLPHREGPHSRKRSLAESPPDAKKRKTSRLQEHGKEIPRMSDADTVNEGPLLLAPMPHAPSAAEIERDVGKGTKFTRGQGSNGISLGVI